MQGSGFVRAYRRARGRFGRLFLALASLGFLGGNPQHDPVKVLARDAVLDDAVVIFDVPPEREGSLFFIAVVEKNGRYTGETFRARAGRHAYDPGASLEAWKGRVPLVVTNLQDAGGTLRARSLSDEIDLFLEPAIQRPNIVNVVPPLRLFGGHWINWVITLWIFATVIVWYATRRVALAGVVGFVIAWAAVDARAALDRYENARWHEKNVRKLMFLEDATAFAAVAHPTIQGHTWTTDPSLDSVPLARNYLVGYALADLKFVRGRAHDEPADFVVTADPKAAPAVCSVGGLYLVRGDVP